MGWHTRCCEGEVYIGNCTHSSGTGSNVPASVTLVVAGITDGLCSNSEDYNGTYVLPWYAGCIWESAISPRICPTDTGDTASISLTATKLLGGNYILTAQIAIYDASRGFTARYNFQFDSGLDDTLWDCKNFDSVELTFLDKTVDFDWIDCSSATVTVTSGT